MDSSPGFRPSEFEFGIKLSFINISPVLKLGELEFCKFYL